MTNMQKQRSHVYAEIERVLECIDAQSSHYQVLDISPGATIEDVRQAYCAAIEYLHPLKRSDLIDSDPTMRVKLSKVFMRTAEAFKTLSNTGRRIEYDNLRNRRPVTPLSSLKELDISSSAQQVTREPFIKASNPKSDKARLANAFGKPLYSGSGVNDRRKEVRFKLHLPVRITNAKDKWREVSKTIDVSQHGIRFSITSPITTGRKVRLELPMPVDLRADCNTNSMYVVRAVVRNVSANGAENMVGAEFVLETLHGHTSHSY